MQKLPELTFMIKKKVGDLSGKGDIKLMGRTSTLKEGEISPNHRLTHPDYKTNKKKKTRNILECCLPMILKVQFQMQK